MYGNQTHFAQSINTASEVKKNSRKLLVTKKDFKILFTIFALITVANISFAGPKQPKLAGGNGNAQGR